MGEKTYDELVEELESQEEAEEAAFREEMMIKGECRWGRQAEGATCHLLNKGICSEDGFPCSYRGKKTGKSCRFGFSGESCNLDYHGVCSSDGDQCSRY